MAFFFYLSCLEVFQIFACKMIQSHKRRLWLDEETTSLVDDCYPIFWYTEFVIP